MVVFYLGRGVTWVVGFNRCGLLAWFVLMTFFCVFRNLPMFWWYLGTCSGRNEFTWVNLRFVGFVVLYLCFSGTWVYVMTKKDLFRLV